MRKLTTFMVSSTLIFSLNAMANENIVNESTLNQSTVYESTVNDTTATLAVPPALVSDVVSTLQIDEQIKNSIQQHWHHTKAELTESARVQLAETIQAAIYAAKNLL